MASITVVLLIGLTIGFISGLIAMTHHQPRCSCGKLLPVSCVPGYGCRTDVRTWAGWSDAEDRR